MELCYRGIHYKGESLSLEVQERELTGKYWGQGDGHSYPRHVPQVRPKPHLQYRGVGYQNCPLIQTEVGLMAQLKAIARQCQTLSPEKPISAIEIAAQTHQANLQRNLAYRLRAARQRGDDRLVALLEKESKQLAFENFV